MAKNQGQDEFAQMEDLPEVTDDEFDPEDGTKEIINISSFNMKFEIDGVKHMMKPGEIRRIPAAYATPQKAAGRDPVPSSIELMTGKNVLPVDHPKVSKATVDAARKRA